MKKIVIIFSFLLTLQVFANETEIKDIESNNEKPVFTDGQSYIDTKPYVSKDEDANDVFYKYHEHFIDVAKKVNSDIDKAMKKILRDIDRNIYQFEREIKRQKRMIERNCKNEENDEYEKNNCDKIRFSIKVLEDDIKDMNVDRNNAIAKLNTDRMNMLGKIYAKYMTKVERLKREVAFELKRKQGK